MVSMFTKKGCTGKQRPNIKALMLGDLSEVYVQTPDYCSRTFTIDKNKIERNKERKHRFIKVR